MFSIIRKRFLSTNISNHLINDIKSIGPYDYEAQWIVNMIDDEKTADKKDGHSGNSYYYTKYIANVIKADSYTNWKNNHVHLSFDDMFRLFYLDGYACIGHPLITMPFDNSLIQEFNKIHKLNNYKIKDPVKQFSPFWTEIIKKHPELKCFIR